MIKWFQNRFKYDETRTIQITANVDRNVMFPNERARIGRRTCPLPRAVQSALDFIFDTIKHVSNVLLIIYKFLCVCYLKTFE